MSAAISAAARNTKRLERPQVQLNTLQGKLGCYCIYSTYLLGCRRLYDHQVHVLQLEITHAS